MATPILFPITPLNTTGQELTPTDTSNVANITLQNTFNVDTDIIEAYVYDNAGSIIRRLTTDYSVTSGKVAGNNITQLNLDPIQDLTQNGFSQGKYQVNYNFLKASITGNPLFYISEVSSDRTELRIKNSSFTEAQTLEATQTLQALLNTGDLFKGIYLDFGSDTLLLAVNIGYDNNTILVKLYEALPFDLGTQSNFNFVEKISEPVAYSIEYPQEEIPYDDRVFLQGPNLNIKIQQTVNNATEFQNFSTLLNAPSTSLTDQLRSILVERRAELNTDYSNFENFIFFSSAEQRLANFYYKASQIENYNNQIATLDAITSTTEVSASKAIYQSEINKIITNFDGYDYYLYFESSSTAWPKSNSVKPYTLFSTGSSEVLTWYTDQLDSGSLYDEFNQNYIYNIYPSYITEDADNDQFKLFNEEVGQMFDQIWLYTKAIENRQDSDNSLSGGISVDLVADALRSYGVTLYESNFSNGDLYTSFLGISPGGSTLPPTGSELITNYVTASADTTPFNDAQKLVYKRLYHNLPFLLKKKGTLAGLRVLLNCFGIPDTILRINEFGGKDENPNTWDNWQSEFSYAFNTSGSNYISSSFELNSSWGATNNRPSAVEFRFKTPGLPSSSLYSQSLWATDNGVGLILKYTGSGTISGSYSGSTVNPEYQYGLLEFYPTASGLNTTASIYLPFFDGGWWSVLINNNGSSNFTIYAKNKIYNGVDGNTIGFQGEASITGANGWSTATKSYFGSSSFSANLFTGSLQEVRYYKNAISESVFDDYVMNPNSIEGNNFTSSADDLVFRATLGGELYTSSFSVHPKASGTWVTTSSFTGTNAYYIKSTPYYEANVETVFYDQVPAGIQNAVSNKIHIGSITLPPTGSTNIPENTVLSTLGSIQQKSSSENSFTRDVNYVEIALSPQNEINDDINSSLGYFNIGEYIGDPRNISSDLPTYPDLESLSNNYFQKYSDSYNWNDYTRLAKYFDNAVFRMVKDFIPARAGVSAGVVIKQHLLERNRQRPAQVDYTQPEYTGSVTSLPRDYQTGSIEVFTGGPGGSVNNWVNISQSWSSSLNTKAGIVNQINSSEYEFYNGEYSGSSVTAQLVYELNTAPLLNNVSESRKSIFYEDVDYGSDAYTPTNYSLILSGSAYKAEIQDSNYTSGSAWSTLRYEGVKNTGQYNYSNIYATTSQAPGYPVDDFTEYFAYFDWIGGSNPIYPGGGNVHIVALLGTDGTVIGLDGSNKNQRLVESVFKKNNPVNIVVQSYSSVDSVSGVIEEGGAYYETILVKSGSLLGYLTYETPDGNSLVVPGPLSTYFETGSSGFILTDKTSGGFSPNLGFINTLLTGSLPPSAYKIRGNNGVRIFDTSIGGETTNAVSYLNTYLPLQYGDFIRFGTTGSSNDTGSIDGSFGGLQTVNIISGSTTAWNQSSSIFLANTLTSGVITEQIGANANQNFRIYRRILSETFVLLKQNPINGNAGLLIPHNFNPNYDPISIAKAAGLIS